MLKWSQLGTFPSIYWFIIQESQELFYSETVERLSPSCIGVFIYSTSSVVSVLMQYNATCVSIGSVKLYVRIYIYTHDHHHTTIIYKITLNLLYKPYVWICIIIYTYLASILVGSSDPCRSCICREELISLLSNILHHLKEQNCYIIFMMAATLYMLCRY